MTKEKLFKVVLSSALAVCIITAIFTGCKIAKDKSEDKNAGEISTSMTGNIAVISREDGSGTRDAFTELMEIVDENGNDITTQSAEITSSTAVMTATVKGNPKAIGYISLGSLTDDVKAVGIDGVKPSTDTVKDGSYVLQRPFIVAYKDDKISDVSKDFISFIMSKEGQEIISGEGYISVGSDVSYESKSLSGTVTISGSTSVAPVMNVLADKYKELNPNVKIEIQEPGSSAGIESAVQDAVEIAMSSRELKDDESASLTPVTIAKDGIAVIVNNENSTDNLTSQQIKSIFTGEATSWEEVK